MFYKHPKKRCYTCACGDYHIYPQKGTIFEDTRLPLEKIFYGFYLLHKEPQITAKYLEKALGVTYATAWKLKRKFGAVYRELLRNSPEADYEEFMLFCIEMSPDREAYLHRPSSSLD